MNLILVGGSSQFLKNAAEELQKVKQPSDEIITISCLGSGYSQVCFCECVDIFKNTDWYFANDQADLEEIIDLILQKKGDYSLAIDLNLFSNELFSPIESLGSIKVIKNLLKKEQFLPKMITIYSYHFDGYDIYLCGHQVKTYIRPVYFFGTEAKSFYSFVTST